MYGVILIITPNCAPSLWFIMKKFIFHYTVKGRLYGGIPYCALSSEGTH